MKISLLWCLLIGLLTPVFSLAAPPVKMTNILVFPYQGKVLTKNTLLKAISRAKKQIRLASPLLNDADVIHALIDRTKKGVDVQIMVGKHKGNAPLLRTKAAHFHVRQKGGPDDGFTDMNARYLVVDERLLLFSGLPFSKDKLSPASQSRFPQGCRGFGYIIHDRRVINETLRIFKMDWAGHRVTPKGGPVIWGPDNVRSQWLAKLKQAQSSVLIMTPHLGDEGIVATLTQLLKAQVKVKVLTMAFRPRQKKTIHEKHCALLRKSGADLHYFPDNGKNTHQVEGTYMLIDEGQLLMNSTHINPSAIDQYRQFGIITMNGTSIQEFLKVFTHDWHHTLRRL